MNRFKSNTNMNNRRKSSNSSGNILNMDKAEMKRKKVYFHISNSWDEEDKIVNMIDNVRQFLGTKKISTSRSAPVTKRFYLSKQRRRLCRGRAGGRGGGGRFASMIKSSGQIVSRICGGGGGSDRGSVGSVGTLSEQKKQIFHLMFTGLIGMIARVLVNTAPNIVSCSSSFWNYLTHHRQTAAATATATATASASAFAALASANVEAWTSSSIINQEIMETDQIMTTYQPETSCMNLISSNPPDNDNVEPTMMIDPLIQYLDDFPHIDAATADENPRAWIKRIFLDGIKQICRRVGLTLLTDNMIGCGTFGQVYRVVRQEDFRQKFVIKCLVESTTTHEHLNGAREAWCLHTLRAHPNVAQLMGMFLSYTDPVSFLIMDSYDIDMNQYLLKGGGDCGVKCGEFGILSYQFSMIVSGIGDAIRYMHSFDIAHHDIKLNNIMLRLAPQSASSLTTDSSLYSYCNHRSHPPPVVHCVLIDFGLADQYDTGVVDGDKRRFSVRKILPGTARYMPPNVWKNYQERENGTNAQIRKVNPFLYDTYSFGVTLAHALLGNDDYYESPLDAGKILIAKLREKFLPNQNMGIVYQWADNQPFTTFVPAASSSVAPLASTSAATWATTITPLAPAAATPQLVITRAPWDNRKVEMRLKSIISLLDIGSNRKLIKKKMIDLWRN